MSRSLYEIAVSLTMVNHAGPLLSALAHNLVGVHQHINAATAASNRFRLALLGAGAALVSGGLLAGMARLVDHGAEISRVIDRMRLAGWAPGDIRHATDHAFDLARMYPSLNAGFMLEMMREMAPVLGSREEAQHMADSLARLMRVLEIQRGPGQTDALHQEIVAAVRAGELSANTLTDTWFREFLDLMVPSINAWGGLVTPRDLAQFFQYARQSGIGLSDRFIRDVAPTLIQEMRASGTGTAMMTMMQAMVGGRMTLRALNAWNDLGLLDRSQIRPENLTPEGRLRRVQPGLIRDTGLLMSDPDRWAHQVLVPALIRAGRFSEADYAEVIAGNLRTGGGPRAREAIQRELMALFGDRTGQGLMGTMIEQIRKIARDAGLVSEASRLNPSQATINENYGMALAGVRGAWRTLNEALALPNMQTATQGLRMLGGVLGDITATVRGMDPSTVNATFIGISAGLATLLGVSAVAIITAVGAWPIVLGAAVVGALVGAAAYVWANRGAVTERFQTWWMGVRFRLESVMQGIRATFNRIADPIVEAFRSMVFRVEGHINSITSLASRIAGALNSIVSAITSFVGSLLGIRPPSGVGGMPGVPGFTPLPAPGTPGGAHRQSWVPPARSAPTLVPIRNVLSIDGHKIGEAVSHYIAAAATHVQSSAQYDGGMGHVPVDLQFA